MANILKSHLELMHSRKINMHKSCYNKEISVLCNTIYQVYIKPLKKYKKNIARRHLKQILVDIYHGWYFDPTLCLAVSFNNNDHTLHVRYNKNKITKKTIELIKDLINLGLLYHKAGMPAKDQYRAGPSYTSRIWPTENLIKYFQDIKFNIINISAHDIDKETVVLSKRVMVLGNLKGSAKARYKNLPIDYSETPKVKAMRLILACYNLLLRKTHIDIGTAEDYDIEATGGWGQKTRCFIEPNSFIHRIFTNNTFNNGGGLSGGWWQNCHVGYKKDILINGEPVIEIAYNASYLGIIYQLEGLNLYELSVGHDVYNAAVPEFDNLSRSELNGYNHGDLMNFKRFIIKSLIRNGIVSTSKTGLWRATIKDINAKMCSVNRETPKPPPSILNIISYKFLASIFDHIREKHSVVSHYFLAGMGPRLQLIESNMAMNLIEHFTAIKVPVLTLHDSYIVEQKWGRTLINAMQCSWIEEMYRLEVNRKSLPKRSKHLERLTSHEDHYHTLHLFAEPIDYRSASDGDRRKLGRFNKGFKSLSRNSYRDGISMQELFEERWSGWCADIVEIKPTTTNSVFTKRYQTSLRRHQEWLLEGDTEDDSTDVKNRYNSFYAGINSALYLEWLRSKPLWMQSEHSDIE